MIFSLRGSACTIKRRFQIQILEELRVQVSSISLLGLSASFLLRKKERDEEREEERKTEIIPFAHALY